MTIYCISYCSCYSARKG